MNSSRESSASKRRKTDHRDNVIDLSSDDDSSHAVSTPQETIPTLPLYYHAPQPAITQPTQLIENKSEVQVAASSPTQLPLNYGWSGDYLYNLPPTRNPGWSGNNLFNLPPTRNSGWSGNNSNTNLMAPAGSAYRSPYGSKAPPKQFASPLRDEPGPRYMGSSDEDTQRRHKNDIRSATFTGDFEIIGESPQAKATTRDIRSVTANAHYQPPHPGSIYNPKNQGMPYNKAAAIDSSKQRPMAIPAPQSRPSRAAPVRKTLSKTKVQDIHDPQVRQKVTRMLEVIPGAIVDDCLSALSLKKDNMNAAVEFLCTRSSMKNQSGMLSASNHYELTSEDELRPSPVAPQMKQQLKEKAQPIMKRYGALAPAPRTASQVTASQISQLIPKVQTGPIKKTRKLVRGSKPQPLSPAPIVREKPIVRVQPVRKRAGKIVINDSDGSDGSVEQPSSDEEVVKYDAKLDRSVLGYLNTCTPDDLADTASITLEEANGLLSEKPFRSVAAVHSVAAVGGKSRKTLGERTYEKCADMLPAYQAVDELVEDCDEIGRPLAQKMKAWGIDLAAMKQELDLTTLKDPGFQPDSGLGTPLSELEDGKKPVAFFKQPSMMSTDITLKDYQIMGINWMNLLFEEKLSGILADDMGLGKTCQVIAFLAHLFEIGQKGPHLVVVPASTLENWLDEFNRFCPTLKVWPLYGSIGERRELWPRMEEKREDVNVVITTYTIAKHRDDAASLAKFGFCCAVFDEAHSLKNSKSMVYKNLARFKSQFRLLLTGTPLQNNLQELISLLAFLMPSIFQDSMGDLEAIFNHKSTLNDSKSLLSTSRIERARQMLVPFILRRKKDQVLKDLPAKKCRVEHCEMTEIQKSIYKAHLEQAKDVARRRAAGKWVSAKDSGNVLMKLRQAAMHPMLSRRSYTDDKIDAISKACLKTKAFAASNPALIRQELDAYSDMEIYQLCIQHEPLHQFLLEEEAWMASGKVEKAAKLLCQFTAEGHKTLIFSQFVMVLDILDLVMQSIELQYYRLDGRTQVIERQSMINEFCDPENKVPVFMLSTKAGGAGINLARASKVIIFDSGFNPQEDVQAENRAHRIGQTQEVEVVRLVTKGTIEENIYAMGEMKLKLDDRVAGKEADDDAGKEGEAGSAAMDAAGQKMVEQMLYDELTQET